MSSVLNSKTFLYMWKKMRSHSKIELLVSPYTRAVLVKSLITFQMNLKNWSYIRHARAIPGKGFRLFVVGVDPLKVYGACRDLKLADSIESINGIRLYDLNVRYYERRHGKT